MALQSTWNSDPCFVRQLPRSTRALALLPRSGDIVATDAEGLLVRALATGEIVRRIARLGPDSLVVTADERHFVTGSRFNRVVALHDLASGRVLGERTSPGYGLCVDSVSVAASPDARLVAYGNHADDYDTMLRVWSPSDDTEFELNNVTEVLDVVMTPDGAHIVTGGFYGVIRVWAVRTRKVVFTLPGGSPFVMTADGLHLISLGEGIVRRWCLPTGDLVDTLPGHEEARCAALTPGGDLVSGHADGTVVLRSLSAGRVVRRLRAHARGVQKVFAPDDEHVVSVGGDDVTRIWAPRRTASFGERRSTFAKRPWLGGIPSALALTRNGDGLYAVTPDGKAVVSQHLVAHATNAYDFTNLFRITSLDTGNVLRTITTPSAWAACLSPEGDRLVLARETKPSQYRSKTSSIDVWSLRTGELTRTFVVPTPTAITVLPRSGSIVTIAEDRTLTFWGATGEVLARFEHDTWFRAIGPLSPRSAVALDEEGEHHVLEAG